MTLPKMKPCPECRNIYVDLYSYENGWQHVECDECHYLGPGEGSQLQAIRSHNAAIVDGTATAAANGDLPVPEGLPSAGRRHRQRNIAMTQETFNDVVTQELIERLGRDAFAVPTGELRADRAEAADALQSQSARIAELEGERSAAIELCDTSVTQCPFSKGRAPAASKPCPKCKAVSAEPCRLQVQAAFEAVRLLKLAASLTKDSTSG